jgi:hypothetical protein
MRLRHAERRQAALGTELPLGASAATLLCGDRPKRPFAEALAEGVPFQAVIPHPGTLGGAQVRVRSVPVSSGAEAGAAPLGWIVYLSPRSSGNEGEPVLFHGMWTRDARMKETVPDHRAGGRRRRDGAGARRDRHRQGAGGAGASTRCRRAGPGRCGPSTARRCRPTCSRASCSATPRARSPAPSRTRPGHVQLADGGTLFLDEVAELPLELQAKLLRMLETRTVLPVGARDPVSVDVRIVSATHRALRAEVEAGRFRADLMFRLRVIPVRLPPLRERPTDIALLTAKADRRAGTRAGTGRSRRSRPRPPPRSSATRGPATSASCATCSRTPSRSATARCSSYATCPPELAAAAPMAGEVTGRRGAAG